MYLPFISHYKACVAKQRERSDRIAKLSPVYHSALTTADKDILNAPVTTVVDNVRSGAWSPSQILFAYGKKALQAHAATNCLTEIMIESAEVWALKVNKDGPLAGMPVSMKDTVGVAGYDSCIGYSAWTGKPFQKDSALIRLLRDAGAVPFVKTNIPITLLSYESYSDVWGRSTNPHNKNFSPGGSTGGEAALLALGGSRIGIGTDVAGSVRIPAHYSGIYTIRASMHRFLRTGCATSMPGQEGIPAVYSPMTRTLEDLEYFWKAIFSMKPWEYDHSVLPIPWRDIDLSRKKVRFGVMWDDGIVTPSPACQRALAEVVEKLKLDKYEVIDFNPPSPYEGLKVGTSIILADCGETATKPIRYGETNDAGVVQAMKWFNLPWPLKRLYIWYIRYIKRDEIYAGLLECWGPKTIAKYLELIAARETYRARWFEAWDEAGLDFLLTVPNPLPAVPHNGMKYGYKACQYAFLFNILDYTCGVLPITHVDKFLDSIDGLALKKRKAANTISKNAYDMYDAEAMHGLPVGVQVVGRRLEEEKVLEGMKTIEKVLRERGGGYQMLEV